MKKRCRARADVADCRPEQFNLDDSAKAKENTVCMVQIGLHLDEAEREQADCLSKFLFVLKVGSQNFLYLPEFIS